MLRCRLSDPPRSLRIWEPLAAYTVRYLAGHRAAGSGVDTGMRLTATVIAAAAPVQAT